MRGFAQEQAVTWSLLLVLAVVVLMVSPWGKWLGEVVGEITTYHQVNVNFGPSIPNPIDAIGNLLPKNNQPSRTNPDTGQVEIQNPNGEWIPVPGAGGNPQIAPGVG